MRLCLMAKAPDSWSGGTSSNPGSSNRVTSNFSGQKKLPTAAQVNQDISPVRGWYKFKSASTAGKSLWPQVWEQLILAR